MQYPKEYLAVCILLLDRASNLFEELKSSIMQSFTGLLNRFPPIKYSYLIGVITIEAKSLSCKFLIAPTRFQDHCIGRDVSK